MNRTRTLIAFIVVAAAALATSGCEFLQDSSEADITSLAVVGQTAPATFSAVDHTIPDLRFR